MNLLRKRNKCSVRRVFRSSLSPQGLPHSHISDQSSWFSVWRQGGFGRDGDFSEISLGRFGVRGGQDETTMRRATANPDTIVMLTAVAHSKTQSEVSTPGQADQICESGRREGEVSDRA